MYCKKFITCEIFEEMENDVGTAAYPHAFFLLLEANTYSGN